VDIKSKDFNIHPFKMAMKSDQSSAKIEKYTIMAYDSVKDEVITTLHIGDKKKSFGDTTEPTRIRRFPIGFDPKGLIGSLYPYEDE